MRAHHEPSSRKQPGWETVTRRTVSASCAGHGPPTAGGRFGRWSPTSRLRHTCAITALCGGLVPRIGGGGRVHDRQPSPEGHPAGADRRTASRSGTSTGLLETTTRVADQPAAMGMPAWVRRRVLLLNASFEPLTALPLRRAIVLVVCGKADVVHGDAAGLMLHSATASVMAPSVIKLCTFVRVPYRARVPMTRAALMHRDRYHCGYCGARAETIDHVVPRSRGGEHCWENCVACCSLCNHRKADRLLSELGWKLRVTPRAPRGQHWRLLATVPDADPQWLPYLGEVA
ncbi:MAG: HNH endonuclease [Pseudonocardiales bacterium]|nr:HNH endonuclease [Pseudonocardiales bacterium]MBV9032031.1 HNH endonuclease [Pseudonocardiales bacterium]MBW0010958.1 HNH endonuclease [Pseudonocardiales bacterium]